MEIGRAFDRDRVDPFLEKALEAGEPREARPLRNAEGLAHFVGPLLEVVRDSDDLEAAVLLEEAGDPLAAVAAADQADIDLQVGLGPAHQLGL